MNYFLDIAVSIVSIFLGFFAKDVNRMLQWIVASLYDGYITANVLKWFWRQFNAIGFFWGMFTGIVAALVFPYLFPCTLSFYYWSPPLVLSMCGCLVGTFSSLPTKEKALDQFYKQSKPWDVWAPVCNHEVSQDPGFKPNRRFKLNMLNVWLGIIAQCCLIILLMYDRVWLKLPLFITVATLLIFVLILHKTGGRNQKIYH